MAETVMTSRQVLSVMHSMRAPTGETKFSVQLRDGAPPDVRVRFFSWQEAMAADYDVFHIHWPEYLLRGRTSLGAARQKLRFAMLLLKLHRRGIPIVRTLHNLQPHEAGSPIEKMLLRWCDHRTDLFIRLNPTTALPVDRPAVTILHGHYVDQFAIHEKADPIPGRILNFGLIRPYKGIDTLLTEFAKIGDPDVSLRIVGKPLDARLKDSIVATAGEDDRVSHDLRFVDDERLVREVTSAELVVLPYREMHNSGTLLVALSLGRPVLAPRSTSNQSISAEVGSGWVLQYDGELTARALTRALEVARDARTTEFPNLANRDWGYVGRQHSDAYRSVMRARD